MHTCMCQRGISISSTICLHSVALKYSPIYCICFSPVASGRGAHRGRRIDKGHSWKASWDLSLEVIIPEAAGELPQEFPEGEEGWQEWPPGAAGLSNTRGFTWGESDGLPVGGPPPSPSLEAPSTAALTSALSSSSPSSGGCGVRSPKGRSL